MKKYLWMVFPIAFSSVDGSVVPFQSHAPAQQGQQNSNLDVEIGRAARVINAAIASAVQNLSEDEIIILNAPSDKNAFTTKCRKESNWKAAIQKALNTTESNNNILFSQHLLPKQAKIKEKDDANRKLGSQFGSHFQRVLNEASGKGIPPEKMASFLNQVLSNLDGSNPQEHFDSLIRELKDRIEGQKTAETIKRVFKTVTGADIDFQDTASSDRVLSSFQTGAQEIMNQTGTSTLVEAAKVLKTRKGPIAAQAALIDAYIELPEDQQAALDQQAVDERREAWEKKEAVADLARKLDLLQEEFGDEQVNKLKDEIESNKGKIIDVDAYTLIVAFQDPKTKLKGEKFEEFSETENGSIKKLRYANLDKKKVQDQLQKAPLGQEFRAAYRVYVTRSERTEITKVTKGDLICLFEEGKAERDDFNRKIKDKVNGLLDTLGTIFEGYPFLKEIKLSEKDQSSLFSRKIQLVNAAAIIQVRSQNRLESDKQIENLENKIKEVSRKVAAVKDVINAATNAERSTSENKYTYIENIINKIEEITSVAKVSQDLRKLRESFYSSQGFYTPELEQKLTQMTERIKELYEVFLKNQETFNLPSATAKGIKEAIEQALLFPVDIRKAIETVLTEECTIVPRQKLEEEPFVNLINTMRIARDYLTRDEEKKWDENATVYSKNANGQDEAILPVDVCAVFMCAAVKLIGVTCEGNEQEIGTAIGNFREAMKFISEVKSPIEAEKRDNTVELVIQAAKEMMGENQTEGENQTDQLNRYCICLNRYMQERKKYSWKTFDQQMNLSSPFIGKQFKEEIRRQKSEQYREWKRIQGRLKISDLIIKNKELFAEILAKADQGEINNINVGTDLKIREIKGSPLKKDYGINGVNTLAAKKKDSVLLDMGDEEIEWIRKSINVLFVGVKDRITYQLIDRIRSTIKNLKNKKRPLAVSFFYFPVLDENAQSSVKITAKQKTGVGNDDVALLFLLLRKIITPSIMPGLQQNIFTKTYRGGENRNDISAKLLEWRKPLITAKEELEKEIAIWAQEKRISPKYAENKIKFNKEGSTLLHELTEIINKLDDLDEERKEQQRKETVEKAVVRYLGFEGGPQKVVNMLIKEENRDTIKEILRGVKDRIKQASGEDKTNERMQKLRAIAGEETLKYIESMEKAATEEANYLPGQAEQKDNAKEEKEKAQRKGEKCKEIMKIMKEDGYYSIVSTISDATPEEGSILGLTEILLEEENNQRAVAELYENIKAKNGEEKAKEIMQQIGEKAEEYLQCSTIVDVLQQNNLYNQAVYFVRVTDANPAQIVEKIAKEQEKENKINSIAEKIREEYREEKAKEVMQKLGEATAEAAKAEGADRRYAAIVEILTQKGLYDQLVDLAGKDPKQAVENVMTSPDDSQEQKIDEVYEKIKEKLGEAVAKERMQKLGEAAKSQEADQRYAAIVEILKGKGYYDPNAGAGAVPPPPPPPPSAPLPPPPPRRL